MDGPRKRSKQLLIHTTTAPGSTMIRNRTNETNPRDNKGKQVVGVEKLLGLQKQTRQKEWWARSFLESVEIDDER